MAFKFVLVLAVISAASAGVIETGWQQPAHGWQQPATIIKQVQPAIIKQVQPAYVKQVVQEAPANYDFNYEVHDAQTGDIKRQWERADNGVVSGEYSLVEPDGFRRVVTYTADDHNGFQANVKREPFAEQKVITKVIQPATIQKVIQPATIQKVIAAPVVASHGWQAPQYSHGWQAPQYSHGWKA